MPAPVGEEEGGPREHDPEGEHQVNNARVGGVGYLCMEHQKSRLRRCRKTCQELCQTKGDPSRG